MRLVYLLIFSTFFLNMLWAETSLATSSSLKFEQIAGDEEFGSLANSIVIESDHEIMLVDAQRTVNNAKKVVSYLKTLNKPLTKVFITHSHPDHILGSAVIKDAFPAAQFFSTKGVSDELNQGAEKMRLFISKQLVNLNAKDQIPSFVVIPKAIDKSTFDFDGHEIKIIELTEGESEKAGMLYIPSAKTIIAGDVLYNNVHLWLHDKRFVGWRKNLELLKKFTDVKTFYPGHGISGGSDLIQKNIEYIDAYEKAVESSTNKEISINKMKQLYPTYKMERFLTFGIDYYFSTVKNH